jgi:hypothetical protein
VRLLQVHPISRDDCFVECETGFRAIPLNKFADCVIVRTSRTQGGKTVQNCGLRLLQIGQLEDCFGSAFTFLFGHVRIVEPVRAARRLGRFSVLICHEARNAFAYSGLQCTGKHSALAVKVRFTLLTSRQSVIRSEGSFATPKRFETLRGKAEVIRLR